MFARWRRRLRYWIHSGERARLLRDEMEFHLEMRTREFMEDGMNDSDARAAARRQFGNLTRQQEESRATWIARWVTELVQDTAYATRTLRRQPGFAAVAALSAALGIGACALVFGIANFALFHPLPVNDPSVLISISGRSMKSGKTGQSLAYPDIQDLRQARSLEGITAFFQFMPVTISSNGEPQRYWGSMVTADYFDIVRPAFALGRGFDPTRDAAEGGPPVAVLGDRLWRSRFAADPGILGRAITLNNRSVTVVGVTAPGFRGTEPLFYSDLWLPFSMADSLADVGMGGARFENRESQWLAAAARLREGVTLEAASAEIAVIAERLRAAYPASNRNRSFHLERAGQLNPGLRKMIVALFAMLLAVAALLLATACANIANLLLARASARQKEIATRAAIGAGRPRLVRQLLTESLMLAMLGGIGGYGLAHLGAAAIGRFRIPLALPVDFSVALDGRVLVFSVALSALTALIFGLVPALRATHPGRGLRPARTHIFDLRHLLVVSQVAIAMLLLIASGLFLRSLASARNIDTGFRHSNLLMLSFDPSMNGYSRPETGRIVEALLDRTLAIPGVESAAITNSVPLAMEGTRDPFVPEGPDAAGTEPITADIYAVSPHFFDTFGIRLLAGQDFPPGAPEEAIAIVNQALAARAFPGHNPIGRRITFFGRSTRIVGLVATAKSRSIGEDPRPCLYLPLARDPRGNDSLTGMTLVLRTRANPAAFAPASRETVRAIDRALAVFDVRTMETHLSQALFFPRTAAYVFGLAGLLGLVIAVIGVYGVISFSVARRTKEIGIRMALGARRGQVVRTVLKRGLLLSTAGAAAGLALAFAASRVAASLLYGIAPRDPLTFCAVPAFLLLVAAAACLVPARRAASLDPIGALRHE